MRYIDYLKRVKECESKAHGYGFKTNFFPDDEKLGCLLENINNSETLDSSYVESMVSKYGEDLVYTLIALNNNIIEERLPVKAKRKPHHQWLQQQDECDFDCLYLTQKGKKFLNENDI